jgi:hypothetical protein
MNVMNSIEETDDVLSDDIMSACSKIDKHLGQGYAEKHPELIGQCVMAFAILRTGVRLNEWIDNFADKIAESLLALQGETQQKA